MKRCRLEAVVIGVSAGALDALSVVLPELPQGFPFPIMIVVHLPPDKKSVIADLFQAKCKLIVKEAEDKEAIEPGTIYFAPPDYHLLVEENRTLSLSNEEPVLYSRPSIDVLFETAADCYGPNLVGIILSGASADGSLGLKEVVKAGGTALVQDPDQAQADTMPRSAIKACADAKVLSLQEISQFLLKVAQP